MINIGNNDVEKSDLSSPMCDEVYDYYNGALSPEQVKAFERHLINCPECEKTIFRLDRVLITINEDAGLTESLPELPPAKTKVVHRRSERKTKP